MEASLDDNDWSLAHVAPSSVASSTTNYIKMRCQPHLSSTIIGEQKVRVLNEQDEVFEKLKTQSPTRKEATFKSELPPDLLEDILNLREDYLNEESEDEVVQNKTGLAGRQKNNGNKTFSNPLKGLKTPENLDSQKRKDHVATDPTDVQEQHRGKAFPESLKEFKTFGTEEDISGEGQLGSGYSRLNACFADLGAKDKSVITAVEENRLQDAPASIDQKLKAYFALQDKTLLPVNAKFSLKQNTVSFSDMKDAVSFLGIQDKCFFFKPQSSHSKLSKPLYAETNLAEPCNSSAVRNSLLQNMVKQSGKSTFSSVPSEHRTVPLPANPCIAVNKPATIQEIESENNQISEPIDPEPPDKTGYSCSEELKRALQAIVLERRSGQPNNTSQVRYHPYHRKETHYQKTLPKLSEFQ